jgi:hypothetical protein
MSGAADEGVAGRQTGAIDGAPTPPGTAGQLGGAGQKITMQTGSQNGAFYAGPGASFPTRTMMVGAPPPRQAPVAVRVACRRSVHTRNKAIGCAIFRAYGYCDFCDCPYSHVRSDEVRPLPRQMCSFSEPGGRGCLRDGCQYFHGSGVAFRALQRSGCQFYAPAYYMPYVDPGAPIDPYREVAMPHPPDATLRHAGSPVLQVPSPSCGDGGFTAPQAPIYVTYYP